MSSETLLTQKELYMLSERACDTEMRNMIRCRMTNDSQEAIKALTEKCEPIFQGILV